MNTTKKNEKLSATFPPKDDKMQVGNDRTMIPNYRWVDHGRPKKVEANAGRAQLYHQLTRLSQQPDKTVTLQAPYPP